MNAQQLYRESGVLGASPVQLVIRLYEKMIDDLRRVSDAIEKNDIPLRTDRIKHTIVILGHLESSLDFEKGGKVARDLEVLYKNLRSRLLHLQFHPSKEGASKIITDLLTVRSAWVQVERAESAPATLGAAASAVSYGSDAADGSGSSNTGWQG